MKNQVLWANSGVLSLSVAVSKAAATGGSLQGTENNSLYGCCLVAAFFVCQREELYRGENHACQERGVSAHKLKNLATREPSFYGNSGNKATASNHAGFSVALVIREVATMATHIFIYLCSFVSVAISKKRGNSVATKKTIKISGIAPVALLPRFLRPRGWKYIGVEYWESFSMFCSRSTFLLPGRRFSPLLRFPTGGAMAPLLHPTHLSQR